MAHNVIFIILSGEISFLQKRFMYVHIMRRKKNAGGKVLSIYRGGSKTTINFTKICFFYL